MAHIRVRPTALIVKDDAILLIEYDDHTLHYNLPGGGAEPGETLKEALVRELYEEACADIEVGPIALMYEVAPHRNNGGPWKERHGLHVIFECSIKEGSIPRLPDHPDPHQTAVKWVSVDELDSILLFPNIQEQIKAYIRNRKGIELIEDYTLKPVRIT